MTEPKHLPPNTTHWHAVNATYEWAQFRDAMKELARKSEGERERRRRERVEKTTYYAAEHHRQQGS